MASPSEAGDSAVPADRAFVLLTRYRWVVYVILLILALVLIESTREPRAPGSVPSGHRAPTQR